MICILMEKRVICLVWRNMLSPEKTPKFDGEMNSNWFKIIMKLNGVQYGRRLLLKGVPVIYNSKGARLKIGDDVTIRSSFLSNLIGLYSRTIIVTRKPGTVVEIGNHVGVSGTTIYARKGVYIGDNTCIGGNCKVNVKPLAFRNAC